MRLKFTWKAMLFIMAVVLAGVPFLLGCGDQKESAKNEVVLGWLGDQTGVSAQTFKEVMWGMDDYFAEMDPIPGLTVRQAVYDTRLDYGRTPLGYEWLKGQDMDLCFLYSIAACLGIKDKFSQDGIPAISLTADPSTKQTPYLYGYAPDYNIEGEYLIDYLVKDWWETKGNTRPIKLGILSQPASATTDAFWQGFDLGVAANPGKCVLNKVTAAMTQTAWVSEVAALKDSDAIILTIPGTAGPSFLKEARLRGYTGRFVSGSASLLGVWTLVKTLLTPQDLDGLVVPHSWHLWLDNNEFVARMATALDEHRPADAVKLKEGTTWQTGWTLAYIVTEMLRDAVTAVGADKVDGAAINDAIKAMSIQIPTWPAIGLAGSGGLNILQPYYRMIEYKAADNTFHAVSDWFTV